ncbi:MAG: PKD domain-containing protein [Flavobacteriales bacterium]
MTLTRILAVAFVLFAAPVLTHAQDCENITFAYDANLATGGPEALVATVTGPDGVVLDETAFDFNAGSGSVEVCIPLEGCCTLALSASAGLSFEVLDVEMENAEGSVFPTNSFWHPDGTSAVFEFSLDGACAPSECPGEFFLDQGEDCGSMIAEIGSAALEPDVIWDYGDGTVSEGGHFTTHTYAQNGTYTVNAVYTSPTCLGSVYTATITIDCYNSEDCAPVLSGMAGIVCSGWIFELDQELENVVSWYVDGLLVEDNAPAVFDYAFEDGVHTVCAVYFNAECPEGAEACMTIQIECGGGCPEVIEMAPQKGCGAYLFEIPGLGDISGLTWTFGDEAAYGNAGGIVEYTFQANGVYEVCASLETPDCPVGITLCTEVEIDCYPDCPEAIAWAPQAECGTVLFEIPGLGDALGVLWAIGEEVIYENASGMVSYDFIENGTYTVCASLETPDCPAGVTLCTEVVIDCLPDSCAPELEMETFACNSWLLFVDEVPAEWWGWSVDGTLVAELVTSFEYAVETAGFSTVCLEFQTEECGLVTLCQDFEVQDDCFSEDCALSVALVSDDECGPYVFAAETGSADAVPYWFVDGTSISGPGSAFTFLPEEAGTYTICGGIETPDCPFGTSECITIEVPEDCFQSPCPEELLFETGEPCGSVVCWIPGIPGDVESILWEADGYESFVAGPETTFTFDENGLYTICAVYESPECPEGVTLCAPVEIVCGGDDCTEVGFGIDLASGEGQDLALEWQIAGPEGNALFEGLCYYGDSPWCDFSACIGEGCHTLYMSFSTPVDSPDALNLFGADGMGGVVFYNTYWDPSGTEATFQFSLDGSCEEVEDDCPEEVYAGPLEDCGWWEFEIGSFVEGELVVWEFGDGTTVTGGHYIQHEYTTSGPATVCGFYTSPLCPDGVEFCFDIAVEDCGCTPVEFYLDSNLDAGGPTSVTGVIVNENFEPVAEVACTYTADAPYCDISLCLADGCYTAGLLMDFGTAEGSFEYGVQVDGDPGATAITESVLEFGLFSFEFGVNAECVTAVEETAAAGFELFPNPSFGNATMQWAQPVNGVITVFDAAGRVVRTSRVQGTSAQLHGLAPGMYTVQFAGEQGQMHYRQWVVR